MVEDEVDAIHCPLTHTQDLYYSKQSEGQPLMRERVEQERGRGREGGEGNGRDGKE